jgi:hypothetical protein
VLEALPALPSERAGTGRKPAHVRAHADSRSILCIAERFDGTLATPAGNKQSGIPKDPALFFCVSA